MNSQDIFEHSLIYISVGFWPFHQEASMVQYYLVLHLHHIFIWTCLAALYLTILVMCTSLVTTMFPYGYLLRQTLNRSSRPIHMVIEFVSIARVIFIYLQPRLTLSISTTSFPIHVKMTLTFSFTWTNNEV